MENNQFKMTSDMKNPYLQKRIIFPLFILLFGVCIHSYLILKDIQIPASIFLPFYGLIICIICLNYYDIKLKVDSYKEYIEELEKDLKKATLTIEEFLPKINYYYRDINFSSSIDNGFKTIVAKIGTDENAITIFSLTKELSTNCLVFDNGKLSLSNGFKIDYVANKNNTLAVITPNSSLDILYLSALFGNYLFSYPVRDYRYNNPYIWSGETITIFHKDEFLHDIKYKISKFLVQEL